MAITNGYVTLAEFKLRLQGAASYTAATLSFASATKKISDSARGLARYRGGDLIRVSGSGSNNGVYTVATGGDPDEIVTTEALVNESAGASVTISDASDLRDDATIEAIIEAASRAIDAWCGRRFYAASETRTYDAAHGELVFVDDLLSVTTLSSDPSGDRSYSSTWSSSDYDLEPGNALLEGQPYLRIRARWNGSLRFPSYPKGVKVVGSFGYAASAPDPVAEACLLLAMRLYRRKDAPLGVVGGTMDQPARRIVSEDPDVQTLLAPYRRMRL